MFRMFPVPNQPDGVNIDQLKSAVDHDFVGMEGKQQEEK